MTNLIFIRHGETPWNALLKVQGCTDISLSDEGRTQAMLLANRLQGDFNAVYCSPLERAFETASIICGNSQKPIAVDDLREINFGSWEGFTFKEIKTKYPNEFNNWLVDDTDGTMLDGDISIRNVSQRAIDCIYPLIKKHPDETILIVSHGGFIKSALIGIFGWNMSMYHHFAMGNTALTTVRFNDDLMPTLLTLNDTTHLDTPVTAV